MSTSLLHALSVGGHWWPPFVRGKRHWRTLLNVAINIVYPPSATSFGGLFSVLCSFHPLHPISRKTVHNFHLSVSACKCIIYMSIKWWDILKIWDGWVRTESGYKNKDGKYSIRSLLVYYNVSSSFLQAALSFARLHTLKSHLSPISSTQSASQPVSQQENSFMTTYVRVLLFMLLNCGWDGFLNVLQQS